jgi:hypothetical protein
MNNLIQIIKDFLKPKSDYKLKYLINELIDNKSLILKSKPYTISVIDNRCHITMSITKKELEHILKEEAKFLSDSEILKQ